MVNILIAILQVVVVIAVAPFFSGLARVVRAKVTSRRGPDVWQDYRDIAKLLRRQEVRSSQSGPVLRVMPALFFAAMVVLAMGIPMMSQASPVPLLGDVITIIYLLALPRFFFSLAALDTGSAYGGVGGIRELIVGVLVEPTMLLSLFACALACGSTNVGVMGAAIASGCAAAPVSVVLAAVAFAVACYIELGKVPFDMAEAEQELQEGPLAEYSGASLALLKLAMGMKQVLVVAWFVGVFVPFGAAAAPVSLLGALVGIVCWAVKMLVLFLVINVFESSVVRVRFKLLGSQTWAVFGISVLSFVFVIVGV